MSDRDILSIPDSAAWRAGVLHERERIHRLALIAAQQTETTPINREERNVVITAFLSFANTILEAQ
jgi:hypothetical protein